jgi:ABC-type branched-subunit amino acid transport system substrate-binding protein
MGFRLRPVAAAVVCGAALVMLVSAGHSALGQIRHPAASPQEAAALSEAQALHTAGRFVEASAALERFVRTYPQSAFRGEARTLLGNIRLQENAYQDAVSILTEVVDQEPDSEFVDRARVDLATAHLALGHTKSAVALLDAVVASNAPPGLRRQAYDRLIALAVRGGDVARGVGLLMDERALPDAVVDPNVIDTQLREIVAKAQDPMVLEGVVDEFPARFPGDLALLRAAQLYGGRGEMFHQERLLQRFLAAFPTHDQAAEARMQLDADRTRLRSTRYVIGLPLPYHGDLKPYATSLLRGAQLAVEHGRVGLPDQSVGLVVKDYGGDVARLGPMVDDMVKEYRCLAVIGPVLSREMAVSASRAQQWRIPMVSPTATGSVGPSRYLFRTALTGSVEGAAVAQYALQQLGLRRFVLLAPQDRYSAEVVAAFTDEVARQGGRVMVSSTYAPNAVDFGREIKQLKESDLKQEGTMVTDVPESDARPGVTPQPMYVPGFDAVFLPGDGETVGLLAAQLAFHDVNVPLLGTSEWNGRDVVRTGGKYVEGGIFVDAFFSNSLDPIVQQFVKQYRARYHEDPDAFAAQAYDATSLLIQAIKTGGTTGERLRDELTKITGFQGVSGMTGFGPEGEPQRRLSWIQIKSGRLTPAL